jgi:Carboxypeptidase regulatory-like domain/TonB dependent receptor
MNKRVLARVKFAAAAVLLLAGGVARAQFSASLSGSVLDATQSVVPGAVIILTNDATKATQTVTSSASGSYRFNELPPGSYSVNVTAAGFQPTSTSNVTLSAETPRTLDLTVKVGDATQTVNVNADEIPLLQTGDASIGTTIDSSEIQRLPIFGADPYELLRTAPGISGDGARSGNGGAIFLPNGAGPGGSNSGIFQTENQVQISADGQRVADNNYMIDGVSVNSLTHGGSAVVSPNQEAVGQITVVSTSYDAALGRNTGAQTQVVTKSGTNAFHGSAFFLYDEPGLNSFNKYGGPTSGAPIPTVRNDNQQRTWAASLGGPIVKDKLFFFASFSEYKQKNPSFGTAYVETPQFRTAIQAQRSGGVSEQIIANPASQPRIVAVLTPTCTGYGGPCAVVNGNGGLDLGSLTPGGTSQLGVFPALASGGGLDGIPDVENVQVIIPAQSRGNQYNARGDWQATAKDLIAGSVYFTKLDNLGSSGTAGSRPLDDVPFKPLNSAATLIYVHTFSPAWINEARANSTRFADNEVTDGGNTVNYGIPYDNVQNYPFAVQYGVNATVTTPATFAENTYEIRDTISHTFGAHTIHAGLEFRFEQDNDNLSGYQRPTYAFNGLWAFANDASVFEAIYANTSTGGVANTQRYFRSQNYAAFIQHDWKVSPNLTFNAGLRWEEFTPLDNKGSQINYPVLGPPGSELSGMKLIPHNHLQKFQHNNYGPKIGFAWTPAAFNNKMVIRGGYALAYNHLDVSLFNGAVEDGPGVANFGLCCGGTGNTAGIVYKLGTNHSPSSYPANPALATGVNANGFPNPTPGNNLSVEVYGSLFDLKVPSSDLYSLEVQRELGATMSATIGYAGATGHHYARLVDQNFLYNNANSPVFAAYFAQTDSVMNYNALNVQLRRPMRHNIAFSFVYTYAKAMDQVSNGDGADGAANQTNPANNASEYGPADYNLKHHVVATGLYQSPTFHTHNAFVDALVNGYQINATYTYRTGFPWTPVTSALTTTPVGGQLAQNVVRPTAYFGGAGTSCSNSAFTTGSNFPNRTGAGGGSNYFKQTLPQNGVYTPGIGRNSFGGPCYQDVDISLAKQFAHDFGDHSTLLRIQANMYNAFNELQLQPIGNNSGGSSIASAFFGYSQAADSGRVIELLARFQF